MASGYSTRKLEAYSLHARTEQGAIDYKTFFELILNSQPNSRIFENAERIVAIPVLEKIGRFLFAVAVEGPKGFNPMIFNAEKSDLRVGKLRSTETLVTATHFIVNPETRDVIVEYNHRGAKADHIAKLFEEFGRRNPGYDSLILDFNPCVEKKFVEALEGFQRIRLGCIKIARPNMDWTDNYNHLTAVAKESNAHHVTLEVTAGRNRSLEKNHGLIGMIKELAGSALSVFKAASVKGTREGESSETTISLSNYIEHQKASVKLNNDGHVDGESIKRKLIQYMEERMARPIEKRTST